MPRPARPRESPARAFERKHAGCWPVGHLAGWRGPSGFSSRSTAREVLKGAGLEALRGRVAVVTGANSGVGFETARALALGGAETVILACRDPVAGAEAARAIQDEAAAEFAAASHAPDASSPEREKCHSPCRVSCLRVDLESFASVAAFADAFKALNLPLHLLVHNAGLMPAPFKRTRDGHERHMQVNVLAPVLLTRLLLGALRGENENENVFTKKNLHPPRDRTSAARVVFVTSAAHRFSYREGVRFGTEHNTDTHATTPATHDPWRAYAESKLCVVLIARLFAVACEASREPTERRLFFFAAHPGAIVTRGSERARLESGGWRGAVLHAVGRPFLKTAEAGAASVAFCCVASEKTLENGAYVANCQAARASRLAERDCELARRACRFALKETNVFPTTRADAFAEQLANGTYGDARRFESRP
jgi:WW domain-containing oxidoreductase